MGLPPTKLGANTGGSTYRNAEMEEVERATTRSCRGPRCWSSRSRWQWLPRGQHAVWNMDAKLRTDTLSRYQAYQFAMGAGPQSSWLLADEVPRPGSISNRSLTRWPDMQGCCCRERCA